MNESDLELELEGMATALHIQDTELARLREEKALLEEDQRRWIAANAPGGWVDNLRVLLREAEGYIPMVTESDLLVRIRAALAKVGADHV